MDNIKIPYGLCEITYGDKKLSIQADGAVFEAIPTYEVMNGGALNTYTKYFLTEYDVRFTAYLQSEDYESLMLHYPNLKQHKYGLYDDASNVDTTGSRLIVHPKNLASLDYDLCIWDAYISPENGFTRNYNKETDKFEVAFVGKPVKDMGELDKSYFFIGNWSEVGDVDVN
jgi:hypothetical protein